MNKLCLSGRTIDQAFLDTVATLHIEQLQLSDCKLVGERLRFGGNVQLTGCSVDAMCEFANENVSLTDEDEYLELVKKVMAHGTLRDNRTGVPVLSVFGAQMRFSLRGDRMPILTTKRVFWRGVVEELLWFMRGSTDGQELIDKGVNIWRENGTRAFLDSRGLVDYKEHTLGPIYGFQWRHFGAEWPDTSGGVDQLRQLIDGLLSDPLSRRHVISAWNPCDLHKMALPPCHILAQFYVDAGELSCHVYQRSADIGLGVPFNIASYALFTHLIATACGLTAHELIFSLGDVHMYTPHRKGLEEQITRTPRPSPRLLIRNKGSGLAWLETLNADDISLVDYDPHPPIALDMVA